MIMRVLDPTNEMKAAGVQPARAAVVAQGQDGRIHLQRQGRHQGLFRASRAHAARGAGRGRCGVAHQSNYSAPADAHIVDEIRHWHAVVTGVGD